MGKKSKKRRRELERSRMRTAPEQILRAPERTAKRASAAPAPAPAPADDRRLPFPPLWPEIAEREQTTTLKHYGPPALAWHALEREAAQTRQYYIEHREQWYEEFGVNHYRTFGSVDQIRDAEPEAFDLRNIQHFQALPSIQNHKKQCMMNAALTYGTIKKQPDDVVQHVVAQVRAEQSHLLYHQAMWRGHGRRVYVLDRTTYELLAATPLPKLPASILSMPYHSFYLKLPEKCFQFEVHDTRTGQHDVSYVEGIAIAMDKIEPDFQGTRELAFTVMGEHDPRPDAPEYAKDLKSEARNTAFISLRLGPDALLSDVQFDGGVTASLRGVAADLTGPLAGEMMGTNKEPPRDAKHPYANDTINGGYAGTRTKSGASASTYGDPEHVGSHELGSVVPRIVIGLLLYLASEHPDVVPMPPTPRRDVESVRNVAKRRKAEQQNARTTRLTMLYVGRNLRDEIEKEKDAVRQTLATSGRTLDHPVWVRGHWRLQPVGIGRALRKTIWIRPYMKGPDVADSLAIRAAKIQRAEHAT